MRSIFTRRRMLALVLGLTLVFGLYTLASATSPEQTIVLSDEVYQSSMYATFWSLVPPVIAIALALISKEVYISLFVGIFAGALFYADFNLEHALNATFFESMVPKLAEAR